MKLFDLRCDLNNFASFLFDGAQESAKWGDGTFDGTPRRGLYAIPSAIRNFEGEEPRSNVLPDFTEVGLRPIPTFSERAVEVLGEVLTMHGELAPVEMDEPVRYFGFNPTTIVDILDEGRSEIARFRDGRVMSVERHVLADTVYELPPIFKIPQTRRNTTYVSETFVQLAKEKGVRGFRFELLFER